MTEITHEQIRDLLPDSLHSVLDDHTRAMVEEHLHSCSECASEMRVLKMVMNAPSFAPMIDAVTVSSAILPYGGVPVQERPAGGRVWKMTLAFAAAAVLLLAVVTRDTKTANPVTIVPKPVASAPVAAIKNTASAPVSVLTTPAVVNAVTHSKLAGELQVAVGLDGLSDGNIAQLARELDGLDALPSADPEHLGVSDPNSGNEGGL